VLIGISLALPAISASLTSKSQSTHWTKLLCFLIGFFFKNVFPNVSQFLHLVPQSTEGAASEVRGYVV
jgi:hypothetical protein